MNNIDKTGLKKKKSSQDKTFTFHDLVSNQLADKLPGTEAIQVYAVGPRITK